VLSDDSGWSFFERAGARQNGVQVQSAASAPHRMLLSASARMADGNDYNLSATEGKFAVQRVQGLFITSEGSTLSSFPSGGSRMRPIKRPRVSPVFRDFFSGGKASNCGDNFRHSATSIRQSREKYWPSVIVGVLKLQKSYARAACWRHELRT